MAFHSRGSLPPNPAAKSGLRTWIEDPYRNLKIYIYSSRKQIKICTDSNIVLLSFSQHSKVLLKFASNYGFFLEGENQYPCSLVLGSDFDLISKSQVGKTAKIQGNTLNGGISGHISGSMTEMGYMEVDILNVVFKSLINFGHFVVKAHQFACCIDVKKDFYCE